MESPAAAKLILRAVELENQKRYQPSLICYQEGIDLLLQTIKNCEDASKKKLYREKVSSYMSRAEKIKNMVQKQKELGKYHDQVKIENDSCGFDYPNIFGSYLDESVTSVLIDDPYIRSLHQISNFLRFCEMLVIKCEALRSITLNTSHDERNPQQQESNLSSIRESLAGRNIQLTVNYSSSLHDREVHLSNGWNIKIGRGLDIFKKADKFSLGFHEMSLRKCHETTVDIFHSKNVRVA